MCHSLDSNSVDGRHFLGNRYLYMYASFFIAQALARDLCCGRLRCCPSAGRFLTADATRPPSPGPTRPFGNTKPSPFRAHNRELVVLFPRDLAHERPPCHPDMQPSFSHAMGPTGGISGPAGGRSCAWGALSAWAGCMPKTRSRLAVHARERAFMHAYMHSHLQFF